ncbi:HAMP domain-containing histidine kinase [Nesterenkonia sp. YGD6]|uniref:sensor histidine kinase n=1 Tax=Nesterenkonia sp. YGD6 TaxID=2901231 RepID=UPI001F4CDAC4|nr:HAMP domain-containing sensor histidine kinase [Nesterenkonia sp. YGD6]MCH8561972.1 HAMP domain-containing histidine kinase [Nesterenkonia sp. YGD6]
MSHSRQPDADSGPESAEVPGPRRSVPRGWRSGPLNVRARILAAVVGLAALALAVSGYTAFAIQQAQVEGRIDAELAADAEQFRVLHEVGVDPGTGEPFSSPAELVRTAMERIIPTRNEGIVGLVDGEVAFTSPVTPVRLEEDEQLLRALESHALSERATVVTIETATTSYRTAIVPVQGNVAADAPDLDAPDPAADESTETAEEPQVGALVMAYDITAEKRVFAEGFLIYAAVALLSLGVVAIVGGAIAGRLLHPVGVLASAARHIGREDLSERIPVTGRDDLTEMTKSVNEMLDRLEESFQAQDQLIHDVSHELRTPLTIVRGHLEVLDAGDRQDVTSTRELTLDELTRMNRVIDDLTTLAQAGRPGFVQRAPTDIGTLTDEVYDKALALGRHRWIVESRVEGAAWVDRERLTQAWLQLAANAVKFSAPGSVIALGSELTATEIRIFVRDQGPGIAAEDQERIFHRFGRTDTSRPGSGLGLPIVAAIAQAHGGRVDLQSAPGVGARFTVVIPRDSGAADIREPSQDAEQTPDDDATAPLPIDTRSHG